MSTAKIIEASTSVASDEKMDNDEGWAVNRCDATTSHPLEAPKVSMEARSSTLSDDVVSRGGGTKHHAQNWMNGSTCSA